jgi:hypothetical protein
MVKHVPTNAHPTIEGLTFLGNDPVNAFQRTHNNISSVLCRSVPKFYNRGFVRKMAFKAVTKKRQSGITELDFASQNSFNG